MLDAIRKGLTDSYKHKPIEGAICVACGRKGVPFALHVIEFYHSDGIATPPYLVPMSQSRGTTRGSVPLCNACCPACNNCSLPISTPWIKKLLTGLNFKHKGITFVVGNGFCRHVHVVNDLMSLFRSAKPAGIDSPASRKSPRPEDHGEEHDDYLMPLDDTGKPGKNMDELFAEGKISAYQYRSFLFLMKTGSSFSSSPGGVIFDVEKKIEELTRIIEEQRKE